MKLGFLILLCFLFVALVLLSPFLLSLTEFTPFQCVKENRVPNMETVHKLVHLNPPSCPVPSQSSGLFSLHLPACSHRFSYSALITVYITSPTHVCIFCVCAFLLSKTVTSLNVLYETVLFLRLLSSSFLMASPFLGDLRSTQVLPLILVQSQLDESHLSGVSAHVCSL